MTPELPARTANVPGQLRIGVLAESRRRRSADRLVGQLVEAGFDALLVSSADAGDLDVLFAAEPRAPVARMPAGHGLWTWRAGTVGAALEVVLLSPAGGVAGRAVVARSPISQRRNREHTAWKAVDLLIRSLRGLGRGESGAGVAPMREGDPFRFRPLRVGRELVRRQIDWRLHRAEWLIAYRRDNGPFTVLQPRYGDFYADPFPFEHDGSCFVFFEHYTQQLGRGAISYVKIGADGRPCEPRPALQRGHHLSYPVLFRWQDDIYMLPATRTGIELYRAEAFPDRWWLVKTAFTGIQANDPTVLAEGDRVWLFANVVRPGAAQNEELHLFWAPSPTGDWTPHPTNPVVCDVRSARPAGRIFSQRGALIRPAQDCSKRYGQATVLNRIERLTETDYREVAVGRIEPDWLPCIVGTHTYNVAAGYEFVDGYRLRLRRPFSRARAGVDVVEAGGELVRPAPAERAARDSE